MKPWLALLITSLFIIWLLRAARRYVDWREFVWRLLA